MIGFLMEKSKISLDIVMLTNEDSSNFKGGNVNYEGILNEKKYDLNEKGNYEENLKTPQILTKDNVHYEGILNGKKQD